ncbi:hypothetical protein E2C01_050289 [Portunus trituberculatus]|uniref:Uncharacterized protein n=1 Tax=Portunus trituberculatus TaxID=210409 RepID=A0A5B7GBN5_PORTR|nr:hypothetical protein [Portunus trituberculatus]
MKVTVGKLGCLEADTVACGREVLGPVSRRSWPTGGAGRACAGRRECVDTVGVPEAHHVVYGSAHAGGGRYTVGEAGH